MNSQYKQEIENYAVLTMMDSGITVSVRITTVSIILPIEFFIDVLYNFLYL